ncbi:hypothetical protein [Cupriavidus sp. WS]|uniref:hypothetical protein n=1 Tax=Cupriavidus sp. WS TaxID=1312922 RepID=UPI0003AA9A59|nr:hypothetical protein [Cupriavidus sp. WS]
MNLLKALWWCPLSLMATITVPLPDPGFEMQAAPAAPGDHVGPGQPWRAGVDTDIDAGAAQRHPRGQA